MHTLKQLGDEVTPLDVMCQTLNDYRLKSHNVVNRQRLEDDINM